MNKILIRLHFSRLAARAGALLLALALSTPLWAQANSKGEEFFMISSVDQQTHQVVLMRPTQLTVAANFSPQTVCLGEKGQKMTPKDLRAGDTVWAIIKTGKNGVVNALRIREGAMTETELRRLYLHYSTGSSNQPPIAPKPLSPAPESGSVQTPSTGAGSPAGPSDATLQHAHKPGHGNHHPQAGTGS
ncbi:MAG: hypothetical protein WAM59_14170 [Candidatus Acidiferrales bacterium]